jgi:hypothetical protein
VRRASDRTRRRGTALPPDSWLAVGCGCARCARSRARRSASDGGAYPRSSSAALGADPLIPRGPPDEVRGRVIPLTPPSACDGPAPAHCRVASRFVRRPRRCGRPRSSAPPAPRSALPGRRLGLRPAAPGRGRAGRDGRIGLAGVSPTNKPNAGGRHRRSDGNVADCKCTDLSDATHHHDRTVSCGRSHGFDRASCCRADEQVPWATHHRRKCRWSGGEHWARPDRSREARWVHD